jgi:hypothetical protein
MSEQGWDGFLDVPEGELGDWKIQRFEVDQDTAMFSMMREGNRYCSPGFYTRLVDRNQVYMSDTRAEKGDHYEFAHKAKGNVLIFGLGLGLCIEMIMQRKDAQIDSITVIENSPDVIALVAPHYREKYGDLINIIEQDAFEFMPNGERYDAIWLDIWPNICTDNKDEYMKLHRRWGRHSDWVGSWAKADVYRKESSYGWW